MKTPALPLLLHTQAGRLESDNAPFLNFAHQYLDGLLIPPPAEQVRLPEMTARLHWEAEPSSAWQARDVRQWGRRLRQRGSQLLITEVPALAGLQLEASMQGEDLQLEAYFQPAGRLQRLALRLDQSRRMAVWGGLVYYLAYFPLIYRLEAGAGMRLLHASAVELPEGGCLLAGLPGSGKSTLSLALLEDRQARLVSDNLLLTDGERAFAVPETIHLGEDARSLLPAAVLDRLAETGYISSHQRRNARLEEGLRSPLTTPKALFFLSLGESWHSRPLPVNQALSRLIGFDSLARELAAYQMFAASLEPLQPERELWRWRDSVLTNLVSHLACWELTLSRGAGLGQAVEWIRNRMVEIHSKLAV